MRPSHFATDAELLPAGAPRKRPAGLGLPIGSDLVNTVFRQNGLILFADRNNDQAQSFE
jgi:hypothetical protein